MSGRGDNNKHGSAGRGMSNQSNQPFAGDDEKQSKSNHNKKAGEGKRSQASPKSADPDANRSQALKDAKRAAK